MKRTVTPLALAFFAFTRRFVRLGVCLALWFFALGTGVQNAQGKAQAPQPPSVLLATSFGAIGDLRPVGHLSFKADSRSVQAEAGTFSAADVGKLVMGLTSRDGAPASVSSQIVAVAADGASATLLDETANSLDAQTGGIGTDNADAIQRCWDASAARGIVCWFPAGQFLFAGHSLTLRSHMSVEGGAPELTALVCAPSIRDCVVLDDGPVQSISMSRLALNGTEGDLPPPKEARLAQRGFYLKARGSGQAGGGLWQSTFAHVQVSGVWGDEFTLEGGTGEYRHPNQFLFFEDLELQTARGAPGVGPPPDSYRLRLVGQNAQIMFSGGQIHGAINSQLGNGVLIDGAGVVRFEGVTCEWVDSCLDVRGGTAIRFTDGWIENAKRVATLGAKGVRGFTFDHNYLANACYDRQTHGGWCLKLASAKEDAGVTFAHNTLAWGVAPPDSLLVAPPGAVVAVVGTLENGASYDTRAPGARAGSVGTGRSVGAATGSVDAAGWRKAMAVSEFIPAGGTATIPLVWSPAPFPSPDFTASCVTVDVKAVVRVEGIVEQGADYLEVQVRNTDPRSPQRATVHCVGML